MRILVADDEKMMRIGMEKEIKKVLPDAEVIVASNGKEALKIFEEAGNITLAFLDVEMPGMNGLEVAKQLKEINPEVNIIMTTAYSNYAVDAYRLHIGGYLMKPVDADDIRQEMDHLQHPIGQEAQSDKLQITCFGEFKVELNKEPVHFGRSKSKEVLAYLVAKHGSSASRAELCDVLFEDGDVKTNNSYLGILIFDLKKSLRECGCEDIIYHAHNEYMIKPDEVYCDYFEFIKGNPAAIRLYKGEFMSKYSWAEEYIWDLENSI